ncbi:hypothetical protein B0T16DRAFT_202036 [Cercophora newfieldiana]|uniref:Uncharacterized protein n=1 Tax=Cercophora newfieldiana TaxID=92897 RepID=A0AA39XV15_9PEZI|nr:hypothetical protein B0T16DRAFT_202036 [Cercophora newfieldiana]
MAKNRSNIFSNGNALSGERPTFAGAPSSAQASRAGHLPSARPPSFFRTTVGKLVVWASDVAIWLVSSMAPFAYRRFTKLDRGVGIILGWFWFHRESNRAGLYGALFDGKAVQIRNWLPIADW